MQLVSTMKSKYQIMARQNMNMPLDLHGNFNSHPSHSKWAVLTAEAQDAVAWDVESSCGLSFTSSVVCQLRQAHAGRCLSNRLIYLFVCPSIHKSILQYVDLSLSIQLPKNVTSTLTTAKQQLKTCSLA